MRGVYSMAALHALAECGYQAAFTDIVASSAGAINAAYFLADQALLAVSVYTDDISSKKFADFTRIKKIVDIDFLVDDVLTKRKPLDVAAVRESATTLHVLVTNARTASTEVFTNREDNVHFMELLRATAAIPVLYNRPTSLGGDVYVDGGAIDDIPIFHAQDLGCNGLLVILTVPLTSRRPAPGILQRLVQDAYLRDWPALRDVLRQENRLYNETMRFVGEQVRRGHAAEVTVVWPSDERRLVGRTTIDRDQLIACAAMARNDVRSLLGVEPVATHPYG